MPWGIHYNFEVDSVAHTIYSLIKDNLIIESKDAGFGNLFYTNSKRVIN